MAATVIRPEHMTKTITNQQVIGHRGEAFVNEGCDRSTALIYYLSVAL